MGRKNVADYNFNYKCQVLKIAIDYVCTACPNFDEEFEIKSDKKRISVQTRW